MAFLNPDCPSLPVDGRCLVMSWLAWRSIGTCSAAHPGATSFRQAYAVGELYKRKHCEQQEILLEARTRYLIDGTDTLMGEVFWSYPDASSYVSAQP